MNAQRRSVNLVPGMSAPAVLHASEGDVGRVLEIVIIDGQLVYNIPSTATVTITATKPSGMGFTQTCTVTENGTATFETTASMTDESGKMQAEVRIVDGGKNIGTANLLWIVERNPHPSNVIDGDVERAKTILERADEAMAKTEQMIEEVEIYNSIVEEVEDIRVGADGTTYASAGDAIRGQTESLKADIDRLSEGYEVVDMTFEAGTFDDKTGLPVSKNYRIRSKDFAATADVSHILVDKSKADYWVYIYFYDENKQFTNRTKGIGTEYISVPTSHPYFKISVLNYDGDSYSNTITPGEGDRDIKYANEAAVVKAINSKIGIIERQIPEPLVILQYPESFVTSKKDNNLQVYFNGSVYIRGKKTRGDSYASVLSEIGTSDKYITIPHGHAWVYDTEDGTYKIVSVNTAADVKSTYIIILAAWWGVARAGALLYAVPDALKYPPYFVEQMSTVISNVRKHGEIVGKDGMTFAFATDLHWENNKKYSQYLIKDVIAKTSADMVVLGGDYIGQYASNKQTAIDVMRECIDAYRNLSGYVYPIFGNHDRNSNQTTSAVYMTKAETYSVINGWMRSETGYGDYFNFYVDDPASRSRLICIDTGAQSIDGGVITAEAQKWVQDIIGELAEGWHVVVVAHWLFSPSQWNAPMVDGALVGSYTSSATTLFNNLDAINSAGSVKVEAIITGHLHCDYNAKTPGGIPIVWTDTDSMGAYGEYSATAGTVSEQCVDIISIDYAGKKIYCDRIGRGVSREVSY